ncbi:MAG: two-component system response regulator [Candidatus Riflebacteria bacterium]|nr:two-component system response regulator [Candidatus Riflebacteria bacterium]
MLAKKTCILIVDDVAQNLEILGSILKDSYSVRIAMNGKKAIEIAQASTDIEMILMDVMMPDQDGFEVCRKLKENPATRKIPIIFVTSMTDVDDETHGFSIGGVDYITKPISPPIVLSRIKTHLSLHNQQRLLEKMVQDRTEELLQTRDITIFTLASLAELRDNETGDHIKRTQYYVKAISKKLAEIFPEFTPFLDEENIDLLYKSAPLHDAGKVGIRDSILLKPGKLTAEEFTIMKTHTTIGRDAIVRGATEMGLEKVSSFLQTARDIAYSHHEKWDGSGYPENLSGESIPLSGRIMALCDVYDALISKRVYKPPFPHEKAVQIIREGSGTHFDPRIVETFMRMEKEFLNIAFYYTTLAEERENLKKSL